MKTPKELKYTKNHFWVYVDGSLAHVGVTKYGEQLLGRIEKVDVTSVSSSLGKHESAGNVIGKKHSTVLFMPVAGEVLHLNEAVVESPDLINAEPYGEGWIIKIEPTNHADLDDLMTADEYDDYVKSL